MIQKLSTVPQHSVHGFNLNSNGLKFFPAQDVEDKKRLIQLRRKTETLLKYNINIAKSRMILLVYDLDTVFYAFLLNN